MSGRSMDERRRNQMEYERQIDADINRLADEDYRQAVVYFKSKGMDLPSGISWEELVGQVEKECYKRLAEKLAMPADSSFTEIRIKLNGMGEEGKKMKDEAFGEVYGLYDELLRRAD